MKPILTTTKSLSIIPQLDQNKRVLIILDSVDSSWDITSSDMAIKDMRKLEKKR